MTCKPKQRSAAILVCVLACLVIVTGLMLAITRSALLARRETRYRIQVRQTDLLLDAGVLRAAQQLQQSPDYKGETWRPSDAIKRFNDPIVKIQVSPTDDDPDQRRVTVTSSLGTPSTDLKEPIAGRTVQSHQFTISTSTSNSSSAE